MRYGVRHTYVDGTQPKWMLTVDDEKAVAAGLSNNDAVTAVKQMATDGSSAGLLHDPDAGGGRADRSAIAANRLGIMRFACTGFGLRDGHGHAS